MRFLGRVLESDRTLKLGLPCDNFYLAVTVINFSVKVVQIKLFNIVYVSE